ncbi:major capsid protein [Castellaniella caeni]|uniref:major capsid protein n=1 Tax=Castellaniella caeni TaxID=266123 RepID=UPI000C9EF9BA|nr:major capsid protein [Castellaniella caeni]
MMNPTQSRVIDPILSAHARGYVQPGLIGEAIFPRVPVAMYGGNVIEFGKEAFRLYNVKRAPGSATRRLEFGYEGKPFAIVPGALEAKVPREWMRDAAQVPGIDLASRAVNTVLRAMALSHEYECAQIALNVGNYDADHKVTLTGTDRWTSAASSPSDDIDAGKEAIRSSIGMRPNTVMLSSRAFSVAKRHPKLLEQFKYTKGGQLTIDQLKELWEVQKIVVGEAVVATGTNDSFGDVWGNDVWLGYVNQSSSANNEEPSYGYTYTIDGNPAVEQPYWEDNAKSWIYGVSDDNSPVLSGMTAGYLIKDAAAAAA